MTHQENFLLISPSRLHIVKGDLRTKEKEIFVCYFETIMMMITWNSRTAISYYLPFSLCQVRSARVVRVDMHFLKPPRPDNETTNNKTFALRNNDNSLTSAVAKKNHSNGLICPNQGKLWFNPTEITIPLCVLILVFQSSSS